MRQNQLNRQVANSTGETVSLVSQRGFNTLAPLPAEPDAEDLILDWDRTQAERNTSFFHQPAPFAATLGAIMGQLAVR